MFARTALLALCSAAIAAASPVVVRDRSPVTLSVARRLNTTGASTLLQIDQARAKALKANAGTSRKAFKSAASLLSSIDVTNGAVDYTASVGVGTPPRFYDLLIDTGSSNTWVGAGQAYVETSSSVDTGDLFVRCFSAFMCLEAAFCVICATLMWASGPRDRRKSSTAPDLSLVRSNSIWRLLAR